jgi:hypothetical protein
VFSGGRSDVTRERPLCLDCRGRSRRLCGSMEGRIGTSATEVPASGRPATGDPRPSGGLPRREGEDRPLGTGRRRTIRLAVGPPRSRLPRRRACRGRPPIWCRVSSCRSPNRRSTSRRVACRRGRGRRACCEARPASGPVFLGLCAVVHRSTARAHDMQKVPECQLWP